MNDSFPFLWPIKVARVVVSLFVSMFYIASLNVFLMACACKKHDGHWIHLVFGVGECSSTSSAESTQSSSGGWTAHKVMFTSDLVANQLTQLLFKLTVTHSSSTWFKEMLASGRAAI